MSNKTRLTSGNEDWGFGETTEDAINDAIDNCCHPVTGGKLTSEWVNEQLALGEKTECRHGMWFEENEIDAP